MARKTAPTRTEVHDAPITSMIEAALTRPAMYTIGGTIPEVAAFLEGYFSGIAKDSRASAVVAEWSDYVEFVGSEIDCVNWFQVFREVASRYHSDSDAFDWLLSQYHVFKSKDA